MRRTTLFLASSMLALATTTAHAAPSLGGVRVESVGDDVAVRVLADAPLENARVRTESGRVRVWFSGVQNRPRLEIDGDGRAIREVALAPGMEETIVLRVELGHDVRIPASDVRVEPTPDGCLVHVPTGWLPPAPIAPPSNAEPTPSEAAANAAPDGAPNAAPSAPTTTEGAADVEAAPAARARRAATPVSAEDEAPALGARRTEETSGLGTRPTSELPIATLGILALALFGAWLYAKKHRRIGAERSDIQILATHRLGPKHQLLVVRALGQDHLLAVHGQTTQVLGTTKPNEDRPSTFLTRLREASDERAAPPPPAPADDADERFGARLLSLVGGRDVAPKPTPTGTSDAVAGLLRLKARQENG